MAKCPKCSAEVSLSDGDFPFIRGSKFLTNIDFICSCGAKLRISTISGIMFILLLVLTLFGSFVLMLSLNSQLKISQKGWLPFVSVVVPMLVITYIVYRLLWRYIVKFVPIAE